MESIYQTYHACLLRRLMTASKQSSEHPSPSNQTKSDTLSQELDDAISRVTTCKDQYETELHTFLSKELEIGSKIIEVRLFLFHSCVRPARVSDRYFFTVDGSTEQFLQIMHQIY